MSSIARSIRKWPYSSCCSSMYHLCAEKCALLCLFWFKVNTSHQYSLDFHNKIKKNRFFSQKFDWNDCRTFCLQNSSGFQMKKKNLLAWQVRWKLKLVFFWHIELLSVVGFVLLWIELNGIDYGLDKKIHKNWCYNSVVMRNITQLLVFALGFRSSFYSPFSYEPWLSIFCYLPISTHI